MSNARIFVPFICFHWAIIALQPRSIGIHLLPQGAIFILTESSLGELHHPFWMKPVAFLQPTNDGLQPKSNGLQPSSDGLQWEISSTDLIWN